MNGYEVLVGS